MKKLKEFYENLYKEKGKEEYKLNLERKRKDFIHKYILFFLNPYKNTRHEIVRKILPSGERILDIGCWTGDSTLLYGAFEKFKEVYGVDISENALKEASKKNIKISCIELNSDELPFPENYFDCITMLAVIEHLVEPYHILKEVRRVIKDNGVFIIGTVNVASLSNRLRIIMGRRPRTSFDTGWDGGHLLYFTPKDLKELLKSYNFEIIGRYATGNLQWLRKLFFPFTGEFIFKCIAKKGNARGDNL